MSEASNLDLLERKIGETLDKLVKSQDENQDLKRDKEELELRLDDLQSTNKTLEANIKKLQKEVDEGNGADRDLRSIKDRVDGILEKFEQLDL